MSVVAPLAWRSRAAFRNRRSTSCGGSVVYSVQTTWTCPNGLYDVDRNKNVNSSDLLQVAKRFGVAPPLSIYDVDHNLNVNSTDLLQVAKRFGPVPC